MIADTLTVLVIGILSTMFVVTGGYLRYFTETNRLKSVLAMLLIVNGIFVLKDVIYYFPIEEGGHFYKTLLTVDNWVVPLDVVYILELLRPGGMNYRKAFWNVFPFIVLTVVYALTANTIVYTAISIFTYLYCAVCFVYVIRGARKYWNVSKGLYSDLHSADIRWLLVAIFILFLLFGLWQLLYFSGNDDFDIYYYILMSIVFGIICYKTENLEVPSEEEYQDISEMPVETTEAGRHDAQFTSELRVLEESGYFFTHPQLSLSELAAELKTNRTTLSQYINHSAGVSYYDFINDIKLKEAVRLLCNSSMNLTLEDIAERSGFNSISTFRRAFVKKYGMSPLEYRRGNK